MPKQRLSKKIFHICIVSVIIVIIIFIAMMFILNYDVNGETNMPFEISKISVISSTQGQDVEDANYKWNINVIQNNDIYVYIEKNNGYKKQETITSVKIDDLNIKEKPSVGEIAIYKPSVNDSSLFKNIDENIAKEIEFKGTKSTNTMNLEISNQGGVLCFRCANNNIGVYSSNDDQQINYDELIKKLNVTEESLNAIITFDITITLDSGKVFKAEDIELKVPNENIIQEGTVGKEYTYMQDIVFKRIEN